MFDKHVTATVNGAIIVFPATNRILVSARWTLKNMIRSQVLIAVEKLLNKKTEKWMKDNWINYIWQQNK